MLEQQFSALETGQLVADDRIGTGRKGEYGQSSTVVSSSSSSGNTIRQY